MATFAHSFFSLHKNRTWCTARHTQTTTQGNMVATADVRRRVFVHIRAAFIQMRLFADRKKVSAIYSVFLPSAFVGSAAVPVTVDIA